MNYLDFRNRLGEFPVFSVREIEKHFPKFDTRRLVEWQEKGYVQKIRNRYYRFDEHQINEAFLYFCANTIYGPSYVSLESALSMHGFIPEGVFQITSCTTLKTNNFETPVGNFAYRSLKPNLFFGYELRGWNNLYYAVANPEKTLIDYLFFHHEIDSPLVLASLRWNAHEIRERISADKLALYVRHIDSKALATRVNHLLEYIDANA
jgi:predicted transcriptional regulator of viral defense system